jgi:hypothetical protein
VNTAARWHLGDTAVTARTPRKCRPSRNPRWVKLVDYLEHAIRVACQITGQLEVLVGAQAILGAYPDYHSPFQESCVGNTPGQVIG